MMMKFLFVDVLVIGWGFVGLVVVVEVFDVGCCVILFDQELWMNFGGQVWWFFGGLFFIDLLEQ